MSFKVPGSKRGSGSLKWLAAGAIILFFILGGLCLLAFSAVLFFKPSGAEKKAGLSVSACGSNEIQSGATCCIDRNGNGICDIREDIPTRPAVSETRYTMSTTTTQSDGPVRSVASTTTLSIPTTIAFVTTTIPSTTSTTTSSTLFETTLPGTSTSTTTSPPGSLVSSCANKYDVPSDTVIYVYTAKCCEKTVSPLIEQASRVRGYKYKYVEADALDKSAEGLLKCYLPPGYISVPQLICPASGNTWILSSQGTFDQIISFSQKCLEAAYA